MSNDSKHKGHEYVDIEELESKGIEFGFRTNNVDYQLGIQKAYRVVLNKIFNDLCGIDYSILNDRTANRKVYHYANDAFEMSVILEGLFIGYEISINHPEMPKTVEHVLYFDPNHMDLNDITLLRKMSTDISYVLSKGIEFTKDSSLETAEHLLAPMQYSATIPNIDA